MSCSRIGRTLFTIALLFGTLSKVAFAQDTTGYTWFVHGAPGRDLSPNFNPALPLDVSVNGTCIVTHWSFGQIKGPYPLPAGFYDTKVSVSNALTPCGNAPIYEVTLPVYQGQTSFAVAAVSPVYTFVGYLIPVDTSPVGYGGAREIAVNASTDLAVSAFTYPPSTYNPPLQYIGPGGIQSVTSYSLGSNFIVFDDPTNFLSAVTQTVTPLDVNVYFLVGSANGNSYRILTATIPGVH
jgi:hypothetical protein